MISAVILYIPLSPMPLYLHRDLKEQHYIKKPPQTLLSYNEQKPLVNKSKFPVRLNCLSEKTASPASPVITPCHYKTFMCRDTAQEQVHKNNYRDKAVAVKECRPLQRTFPIN